MPADVKDFLHTPGTCYNCSKLSHFALDCIKPKKAGLRGHIQEISNINKDKDEKETEEKNEETLETEN